MCALSIISEKILFDRRRVVIHLLAVKFKCSRTGVVRPLERELDCTRFFLPCRPPKTRQLAPGKDSLVPHVILS